MAGRAIEVVRDEEDGRQEGRRPLQRQLQWDSKEYLERGKNSSKDLVESTVEGILGFIKKIIQNYMPVKSGKKVKAWPRYIFQSHVVIKMENKSDYF